ncbi:MAG TPA: hypothetical protein VN688_20005 [Gemmataceae bacterium]|nr:hypothetical protein [Gemmataceae bacterium]
MSANWKNRLPMVLAAGMVMIALIVMTRYQPARAERLAEPASGPRYSVVETEGHNLLVTDNAANKLYFYTVDKDKPVGSPLKLRASLDLSKVGEAEINIKKHEVQK